MVAVEMVGARAVEMGEAPVAEKDLLLLHIASHSHRNRFPSHTMNTVTRRRRTHVRLTLPRERGVGGFASLCGSPRLPVHHHRNTHR
eukprot:1577834-Prymnesium_polylepis.2